MQRKQPPKLQHHQTESAKVRNRVWFRTGPNSKSTNQERPQNISILCKHIIPDTHSHTLPSTILQIYKQCVRPIFEYGSLSNITTSDTIISEIQRLQNKFIRLPLRLPKYISVKLLHDSSGLPYVKDRLFSRPTKTLERISANSLVEESISSNRVNPAWDRFPTPLSVIRPVSL